MSCKPQKFLAEEAARKTLSEMSYQKKNWNCKFQSQFNIKQTSDSISVVFQYKVD